MESCFRKAEAGGFEAFVTVDQNLKYQQKLQGRTLSIVVVIAVTNRLADLAPLAPQVLAALASIKQGELIEVQ